MKKLLPITIMLLISFAAGAQLTETDTIIPQKEQKQRKNAIKYSQGILLLGTPSISYERMLSPKSSMEAEAGILQFGLARWDMQSGFVTRAAYKYYFRQKNHMRPLDGAYFKPELSFSYYNYDTGRMPSQERIYGAAALSFSGNIGRQWVFKNIIALDLYGGTGVILKTDDNWGGDLHGGNTFVTFTPHFGIVITGGIKLGFVF